MFIGMDKESIIVIFPFLLLQIFLLGLILSLVQQWIQPTVRNSMVPFTKMHAFKVIERLLKLAVSYNLTTKMFHVP